MKPSLNGRDQFDRFEFDRASGELFLDGRKVRLQRQPSRLLELLLARSGEVVSRDAIRQALWGDDTHVDFDRSLNFCVAKLRSALRDDAAAPRFVETVPGRGYRFIAAAKNEAESDRTEEAGATGEVRDARGARWLVAASLGIAAVLTVAAISAYLHPLSRLPKIVVVPFHNETGSPDLDRLAKGVSDAAVARLATPGRLPRLLVIGNATGLTFSFKPPDMKAMGESLGAQYLLMGQLKQDDRRFRIVAHLIRVEDQTHQWAKTYDTDTLDLPQQSSIAEEIARSVAESLAKH